MQTIPDVRGLKNILVLRGEGSLGDAIISSCCYRELKKANPGLKITVACFGSACGYLKASPYIDEIYRLPIRRVLRPNQRWLSLIWHALKLRGRGFDLVLDSSEKPFKNWTLFKKIIGGERVLDCYTSPEPLGKVPGRRNEHEQTILRQLGVPEPDKAYDLPVSPEHQAKRDAFVSRSAPDGYVLLNPFGSVSARTLNKTMFRRVLTDLYAKTGKPVLVPCMPAQKDTVNDYLAGAAEPAFAFETADVFDLFALTQGADLVVTPDTAVVHVASGFRKKSVIFYNTYSIYNDPDNPHARVVKTNPVSVNQFNYSDFTAALDGLL